MTEIGNSPVALSILLDRSGSMMSIADDIVVGVNSLLANQRTEPGEVIVTIAQFDSQDPFELLVDGKTLDDVADVNRNRYQPRGSTPLFDAIGKLLMHIDNSALGERDDVDHVVAIVTDGMENASTEFSRKAIFDLIKQRGEEGWVFIYLGSEPESYADASSAGVSYANTRHWDKSGQGTADMMANMSLAMRIHRAKTPSERYRDKDDFYEDGGDDTTFEADGSDRD